jgi:polyisoprenoid-binding protein YceI
MKKILLLLSVVFAFECTNNSNTDTEEIPSDAVNHEEDLEDKESFTEKARNTDTDETDYTAYGDSTLNTHVKIDIQTSTIKWVGSTMTDSHYGTVNIQKGVLDINNGELMGGEFVIDMNSIINTDLESEKKKAMIEGHLKDEDFFDVKNYPLSAIKITDAVKSKGSSYKITADLTIKDIMHPINFDSDVNIEGLNYLATAKIKIDRTKWDIKYNSANFFKDLGDRLIKDEVEFAIILSSEK